MPGSSTPTPTPSPIVVRRELQCAAPPKAIFELLGDTARLLRTLGQPLLARTPVAKDDGARFELRPLSRRGHAFTELPPEWTVPTQLCLRRAMGEGPLEGTLTRFSLTPLLAGTKLTIELSLTPRVPALAPLLHLYAHAVLWNLARTIGQIDAALLRGENRLLKPPVFDEAGVARALTQVAAQLEPSERDLVARLVTHLRGLDTLELESLAPAAIATALELEPDAALRLLLIAAAHGLLALSWDVLCPSCRLPAARFPRLGALPPKARCELCDLEVPIDLAGNVEVTFRPSPSLRRPPAGAYSGPGPSQLPHVLTQLLLPPLSSTTLPSPTEPGDYAVVARGGRRGRLRVSPLGPQKAQLTISETGIDPATVEVAVGGTLEITHPPAQARHVTIERPEWSRSGVSGHEVTAHPVFRAHFPAELLAPGIVLSVPPVALWLSELAGMAEICAQLGDGPACALVEAQRQRLQECVTRHGGALIVAERDGTCAVFRDPEAATRAAAAAQRAVAELRSEVPERAPLALRLGLYSGPCSLLTQNGHLAYYGVTALVAARLLREAHAGDVVLPAELGERGAAQLGAEVRLGPRFSLSVKGLAQPVSIARLTLAEPSAAAADPASSSTGAARPV